MKKPSRLRIHLNALAKLHIRIAAFIFIAALQSGVYGQRHDCTMEEQINYAVAYNPESYNRLLAITQASDAVWATHRTDVVLPIVVHIVYSDDTMNITDFQIYSQIEALNEAFAHGLELSDDILPEHRALATVPGISFRLACVDPEGRPTTGITRTSTSIAKVGSVQQSDGTYVVHHDDLGGKDPWPTDQYINIWVCELDNSLLGRATLPIDQPDPKRDGIVISYRNFGYAGIAPARRPYHLGRTLVHEMGHYLGLQHPWGTSPSCDQDDGISDTPPQSEIYYDCPSEGSNSSSCGSPDMTKNFMGYVDDDCAQYFTAGQVNLMHMILNGYRSSLLTSTVADNCGTPHTSSFKLWHRVDEREWMIATPSNEEFIDFMVYNMKGQLIQAGKVRNETILHLPPTTFAAGLYIIQFRWDDQVEQRVVPLY